MRRHTLANCDNQLRRDSAAHGAPRAAGMQNFPAAPRRPGANNGWVCSCQLPKTMSGAATLSVRRVALGAAVVTGAVLGWQPVLGAVFTPKPEHTAVAKPAQNPTASAFRQWQKE